MKLNSKILFAFILLFSSYSLSSQSISSLLRKAHTLVDKGDFAAGAEAYKKVLAKDSNHLRANLEYGLLLFEYMNESSGAGRYLLKAEKNSGRDTFPELLFGLAKCYHHDGHFQKASWYYHRFKKYIDLKDDDGKLLWQEVERYQENCRFASKNTGTLNYARLRVKNAGPGINTIYPEYVPVVTADGKTIMFTSRRRINPKSKIDKDNGGFYEDMFMAQRGADGKFTNPVAFSLQPDKTPGRFSNHEAAISLSFVEDKFYTFYNGLVYESAKQGNGWSQPVLLNEAPNSKQEFRNHITVSRDGKVMYFSAEREDGLGGLDIYRCEKLADGKWGPGSNLGPTINTREDDGAPQLSEDEANLYFSSKGLPGYGGYDLFKVKVENGQLSDPINLGRPFNSAGDDIYLSINKEENSGYFSSSRAGGYGDVDIYEIGYLKPFEEFKLDSLGRLLVAGPDTLYLNQPGNYKVDLKSLSIGDLSTVHWQANDSVYQNKGTEHALAFGKPGEFEIKIEADMKDGRVIGGSKKIKVIEQPLVVLVEDKGGLLPFEDVFFALNSASLDETALAALGRNIDKLKDKSIILEVTAYADPRGTAAYNLALTKRRANAAAAYLRAKGLKNLKVKWMGENDPLSKCRDDNPCTEDEYRLNRRVEMKWVEVKK